MAKVFAGVDSLRQSQVLGLTRLPNDYIETTTTKFSPSSFKPAGDGGASTAGSGAIQRSASYFNQSSQSATRYFKRADFFTSAVGGPQYAWDCWFYLNSSSSGKSGDSNTPSIFSWAAENSSTGVNRSFEIRPTADNELSLVLRQGSSTIETLTTINASSFSETNFLGAWWWIAFQRNGQDFDIWMGKSGTATNIYSATKSYTYYSKSTDQYRIGATGTGAGTPAFTPIDGFIDEVAVRKGTPFSGTVSCPTAIYTGDEEGMVDLYHFDNTLGSTAFRTNNATSVNFTDGSNIGGTFGEFLQTFNPNATTTNLTDQPAFGTIGYTALRVGDVTVDTVDNAVAVSGVSASTSLGDPVPENQVIGVSLLKYNNASKKNATRNTTTLPFSGVASWELLTTANETFFQYPLGSNDSVYFAYNDFTIEMFLRGDGTNRGGAFIDWEIENDDGSNPGENPRANLFATWDTSGATEKIKILNQDFPGSVFRVLFSSEIPTTDATSWYHVALIRKDNKYSLFWNGNRIAHNIDSSGNGTADVIGIDSDDAYLFAPIGGNRTFPYRSRRIRFGGAQTSFGVITPANIGFVANMRTSYIAQYDPDDPTLTVPTAPFELDTSGQDFYYKDNSFSTPQNDSTTLPTSFNDLVLENASLGDVTVELIPTVDVFPTGVSASTSLGDLVPDSEVIGVSLERHTGGGLGAATGSSAPTRDTGVVPFTGVDASYDVGDNSNKGYCTYTSNTLKNVYSFYNDFTVELFVRGDGINYGGRFLGIQILNTDTYENLSVRHDISGPAEQLVLYNQEDGTLNENDLVSTDIPDAGASNWKHFALVRKNNKYSMFWDGKRVAHNIDSSGNGTVNGGGSINISSNEAYLFKPFGGNNPFNQNSVRNVRFGVGLPFTGGDALAGYLANTRISYIAQYDPDVSSLDVPTAPFDADASGQEQYNKGQTTGFTNFATTLPTTGGGDFNTTTSLGSVSVEVLQEVLANGSLLQVQEGTADVRVELSALVTGQSLTTSLGTAAAGPGVFAPTTGQNLTVSLGSITLPVSWGNVSTGTTSTWIPVDTGGKSVGP